MGSAALPSLFQLSRCPPHAHLDPEIFSSGFLSLGDLKEGWEGDCTDWDSLGGGGSGLNRGGIARSLGTWRERLTWRRLRGEGSALQELHCEHKAKAEGEGRDQAAAPTRLPRLPSHPPNRATPTVFWIQYFAIVCHTMRFIFKSAFVLCFQPRIVYQLYFRGTRVCARARVYVYVYMWRRGLGRVNNSTFSKTGGGKEETSVVQKMRWLHQWLLCKLLSLKKEK